jgi:hypothetical protein
VEAKLPARASRTGRRPPLLPCIIPHDPIRSIIHHAMRFWYYRLTRSGFSFVL